jgi:hypothetical protein
MNPKFRILGAVLEPSAMGRAAEEQEPGEKGCPVHRPSIHCVRSWQFLGKYPTVFLRDLPIFQPCR